MTQPSNPNAVIDVSNLQHGLPAITPAFGAALAEASAICLTDQEHKPRVVLEVKGKFEDRYLLLWPEVTEQMRRCWNDEEYTTEQGAYGIALLLIQQLTDFTVIERSRRGTGFDYWLGKTSKSGDLPFQKSARLEVSGIRRGSASQIRTRATLKMAQVHPPIALYRHMSASSNLVSL